MDIANVQLIGYLGKDVESKMVNGKQVVNISVATSRGPKDAKVTDWHNISFWEKSAELAIQYLHKGDRVYVEGQLRYNRVGEGAETRIFTQISGTRFVNLTLKAESNTEGTVGLSTTNTETTESLPF